MFVVRKINMEVGREIFSLLRGIKVFAEAWKGKARMVARRDVRMTDRADDGLRPAEKLLLVATNTGSMPRVLRHVREGGLTFANLLPVRRREGVARIAGALVLLRAMRKV